MDRLKHVFIVFFALLIISACAQDDKVLGVRTTVLAEALKIDLSEEPDIPEGKIELFTQQNKSINMGEFQMLLDEKDPHPWNDKDMFNVIVLDSHHTMKAIGVILLYDTFREARLSLLNEMVDNSLPIVMIVPDKKIVKGIGNICIESTTYNYEKKTYVPVFSLVRGSTAIKLVALPGTTNLWDIAWAVDETIKAAPKAKVSKEKKPLAVTNFLIYPEKYEKTEPLENTIKKYLKEWKEEIKKYTSPFSSQLNYNTPAYYSILSKGPKIAPILIKTYLEEDKSVLVFFPDFFKAHFDSTFDKEAKCWQFTDYPDYKYFPPAYNPLNKNDKYDSIWIYWWQEGRRLTPELFQRKYHAYSEARKAGNTEETARTFEILQNMGIIILPNILGKMKQGDESLLPMFVYLSGNKELKTVADCQKWWEEKKDDYRVIWETFSN